MDVASADRSHTKAQAKSAQDLVGNSAIIGNPGTFMGLEAHLVQMPDGPPRLAHFEVVQATEGTWLSAAAKELGWDRVFGAAEGYGAYSPGVVFKPDLAAFEVFDPDQIQPGERFLILLPDQPTAGGDGERAVLKPDAELLPYVVDILREPGLGFAAVLDKGSRVVDWIGMIDEYVAFGGMAGAITGTLGIVSTLLAIPLGMAAAGRCGNITGRHAGLRAACYASTAWLFEDRGNQVSSVCFNSSIPSEISEYEEGWAESWQTTTIAMDEWLNTVHAELDKAMRARFEIPPTRKQILEGLRDKAGGSATAFCAELLSSPQITDQLGGSVENMLWTANLRTQYPD